MNYYVHLNICPTCKRAERTLHIGKSSGGWTFSFQGYDYPDSDPRIASYKDWLRFLESCGGEIRNEYDEAVALDDLKRLIDSKRGEKRNHTTWCRQDGNPYTRKHGYDDCWLDDEGHSFSRGEFS